MEWLTDAYPCNSGAFFFWVVSDDTDGTWSSQVDDEAINGGEFEFPFNESILLWFGCASACALWHVGLSATMLVALGKKLAE